MSEKSEQDRLAENVRKVSGFRWTRKRQQAVVALAKGYTQDEVAQQVGISDRTIRRWKRHPEFAAEINRLSLMVDIAGRGERIRIAMRVARNLGYDSNRDLLDWLKFVQSETDGVKLDLTSLIENALAMARAGQEGVSNEPGNSD